jgi:hypothetical protein
MLKMAYLNELSKRPGAITNNALNFQGKQEQVKLQNSAGVQMPVKMINAVTPTLNGLADSANKIGMTDNMQTNAVKGMWNTSVKANDDYSSHLMKVTEARKQVASVLAGSGAPSEVDKADAASVIPMWAPGHVYANAVNTTIPQLLAQRKAALLNQPAPEAASPKSQGTPQQVIAAGLAAGKSREDIKSDLQKAGF